ncbi:enterochelin esterase domain-containing protein [Pseudactinotalea sp.]|uniref:enterochelin esterase domain-containing protein n=1 Tax=Pseudactinotalea sp. TaxID=1926260 RepID=UPI003B3AAA84
MNAPRTAEPTWLRELLAQPDRRQAVADLWDSFESAPLLGETRDGLTEVTFLWRQQRADVEVLVHVNGLTDAMREDVTPALLEQVPGTDLWHRSWWLPADGTWGYRFVEMPEIPRNAGASREGWLAIHGAGALDPLNPRSQPHALGESSSVIVLPRAYQHPAWPLSPWSAQSYTHAEIEPFDGESRAVHLWSPSPAEPAAVLVLLDGEQWAAMGIADVVAAAGIPVDLVLVDSVDFPTRSRDLPDPERAAALVAAALEAYTRATGHLPDASRTILAGQSYGGLAAASTVVTRRDLASTAVVQSGSFWYRHGVPPARDAVDPGDLTTALAGGERDLAGVRLALQAGTDEGTMAAQAEMFRDAARDRGADAELEKITGGHDYAWWKHHLLRAVEALVGPRG